MNVEHVRLDQRVSFRQRPGTRSDDGASPPSVIQGLPFFCAGARDDEHYRTHHDEDMETRSIRMHIA
jgi:hypothetical protein